MAIERVFLTNWFMPTNGSNMLGAIEAGGTKFVLAVGNGHDGIINQTQILTTTPDETLRRTIEWFQGQAGVSALGIASFGPVDLNPSSSKWGYITDTPKLGWSQTSVAACLGDALRCAVEFDTDVNGAMIGEYLHGAAQGCDVPALAAAR
jgi:fructokinase